MRYVYAVLVFAMVAFPLRAEEFNVMAYRLTVFENTQKACKATVLLNRETANSFVEASNASLSEVCECAALLVVANKTDDQIAALAAGDEQVVKLMTNEVRERFVQCLRMQD